MELTPENKEHIDSLSYDELLSHWRFASAGDPWFCGETGAYWAKRMSILRYEEGADHVAASKRIGWEREGCGRRYWVAGKDLAKK